MNLRNYSDEQLLDSTWQLACADRRLITALLHHLNEIALRRLYAKESYPSLFAYCVRVLMFSEGQAQIRICAARLMEEFPEIEGKITAGSLSLSAAAEAQIFFRSHPMAIGEKKKLLSEIEHKSAREVKKIFRAIDPRAFKELIRPISEALVEYRFAADSELVAKLDRLKNILGSESFENLIQKMADVTLQKYDPLKKAERNLIVAKQRDASRTSTVNFTRYIPAQIRHQVWLRDQATCTFPECGSQFALELDHIHPFAKGGQHTAENLRLRCKAHNQLHAENEFGRKKMSEHRRS